MNMYPMYEKNSLTMKNVEDSFGGNICRCTGYRPILEAFKSLAKDAPQGLKCNSADVEDLPLCKKGVCERRCKRRLLEVYREGALSYKLEKSKWVKVFTVNEILDVLKENPEASYMLVGGNTASGNFD